MAPQRRPVAPNQLTKKAFKARKPHNLSLNIERVHQRQMPLKHPAKAQDFRASLLLHCVCDVFARYVRVT